MLRSHCLTICKLLYMQGRLVQLDFSAAFDRISSRGLLYKLRSMSVGGKFLSIVSQFLSDRRQRVSLKGKVSVSVDVVPGYSKVVF